MKSLKEKLIELFQSLRDSWNKVDAKDSSDAKGDSNLDATFRKAYMDGAAIFVKVEPQTNTGSKQGSSRTQNTATRPASEREGDDLDLDLDK